MMFAKVDDFHVQMFASRARKKPLFQQKRCSSSSKDIYIFFFWISQQTYTVYININIIYMYICLQYLHLRMNVCTIVIVFYFLRVIDLISIGTFALVPRSSHLNWRHKLLSIRRKVAKVWEKHSFAYPLRIGTLFFCFFFENIKNKGVKNELKS